MALAGYGRPREWQRLAGLRLSDVRALGVLLRSMAQETRPRVCQANSEELCRLYGNGGNGGAAVKRICVEKACKAPRSG